MPEEFGNKDIPEFSRRVNVPRMPSDGKKNDNKTFDHLKDQGKKAFHFEVAKEDVAYFKYLEGHAHWLRLDNKFFGKFTKFTATLSNNAPMSDWLTYGGAFKGTITYTSAQHPSPLMASIHWTPRRFYATPPIKRSLLS